MPWSKYGWNKVYNTKWKAEKTIVIWVFIFQKYCKFWSISRNICNSFFWRVIYYTNGGYNQHFWHPTWKTPKNLILKTLSNQCDSSLHHQIALFAVFWVVNNSLFFICRSNKRAFSYIVIYLGWRPVLLH